MAPSQVCALLCVALVAGPGAPLARAAPVASAPASRSAEPQQGLGDALPSDYSSGYDYYDYYDYYDEGASAPSDGLAPSSESAPASEGTGGDIGTKEQRESEKAAPRPSASAAGPRAQADSSLLADTRKADAPVDVLSMIADFEAARQLESLKSEKPRTIPRRTSASGSSRKANAESSSTTDSPATRDETTRRPSQSATKEVKDLAGKLTKEASKASPAAIREPRRTAAEYEKSNSIEPEQDASESSRVVTLHVQRVHHSRVAKSPRDTPDFFVPPIQRQPTRRRVPLTSQRQLTEDRSLGELLAQQVRQQLAQLQAEQGQTLPQPAQEPGKGSEGNQESAETTTQRPTASTPAATTAKPYKHPFIPSSPTTTSEPYVHPFIPSSPTTTSEPYRHPFIPSPPTTTSKPYQHPFIPSSPTTTAEPYKHPHIPVPPESTRRPLAQQSRRPADLSSTQQSPASPSSTPEPQPSSTSDPLPASEGASSAASRPSKPEAPSEADTRQPRLHLPRRPEPTTPAPTEPTPAPAPGGRSVGGSAGTIVHQETLREGFIVGEYGELRGGGTVRGVKYAADSSVDRRLLEDALQRFLRL